MARSAPHFSVRPWGEIGAFFRELAPKHENFGYMVDIVDSVLASDSAYLLAAHTSMHDLIVAAEPVREGVWDKVAVRSSGSFDGFAVLKTGEIAIEHLTATGRDDRVIRPGSEAVPLFWRFMIEKFGIHPGTRPTGTR